MVATRVVSPEISGNFLRKISGNLFQSSLEIYTENFLPVQTFQLLTSSLSIGFCSTSVSSSALTVTLKHCLRDNCDRRHCMHGLIEIHTGFKIIGNIYYWGKFPEISS